jgi:hypothetical protein
VKAVVEAYANGDIKLKRPEGDHNVKGLRIAPQFRVVSTKEFDL